MDKTQVRTQGCALVASLAVIQGYFWNPLGFSFWQGIALTIIGLAAAWKLPDYKPEWFEKE